MQDRNEQELASSSLTSTGSPTPTSSTPNESASPSSLTELESLASNVGLADHPNATLPEALASKEEPNELGEDFNTIVETLERQIVLFREKYSTHGDVSKDWNGFKADVLAVNDALKGHGGFFPKRLSPLSEEVYALQKKLFASAIDAEITQARRDFEIRFAEATAQGRALEVMCLIREERNTTSTLQKQIAEEFGIKFESKDKMYAYLQQNIDSHWFKAWERYPQEEVCISVTSEALFKESLAKHIAQAQDLYKFMQKNPSIPAENLKKATDGLVCRWHDLWMSARGILTGEDYRYYRKATLETNPEVADILSTWRTVEKGCRKLINDALEQKKIKKSLPNFDKKLLKIAGGFLVLSLVSLGFATLLVGSGGLIALASLPASNAFFAAIASAATYLGGISMPMAIGITAASAIAASGSNILFFSVLGVKKALGAIATTALATVAAIELISTGSLAYLAALPTTNVLTAAIASAASYIAGMSFVAAVASTTASLLATGLFTLAVAMLTVKLGNALIDRVGKLPVAVAGIALVAAIGGVIGQELGLLSAISFSSTLASVTNFFNSLQLPAAFAGISLGVVGLAVAGFAVTTALVGLAVATWRRRGQQSGSATSSESEIELLANARDPVDEVVQEFELVQGQQALPSAASQEASKVMVSPAPVAAAHAPKEASLVEQATVKAKNSCAFILSSLGFGDDATLAKRANLENSSGSPATPPSQGSRALSKEASPRDMAAAAALARAYSAKKKDEQSFTSASTRISRRAARALRGGNNNSF